MTPQIEVDSAGEISFDIFLITGHLLEFCRVPLHVSLCNHDALSIYFHQCFGTVSTAEVSTKDGTNTQELFLFPYHCTSSLFLDRLIPFSVNMQGLHRDEGGNIHGFFGIVGIEPHLQETDWQSQELNPET